MRKKFVITLWVILFLCISAVSLAFYAIWHGWIGYMPNLYQLENPVNKYASQAVSADGKLLGTWSYSRANRIFVGFDDLSPGWSRHWWLRRTSGFMTIRASTTALWRGP